MIGVLVVFGVLNRSMAVRWDGSGYGVGQRVSSLIGRRMHECAKRHGERVASCTPLHTAKFLFRGDAERTATRMYHGVGNNGNPATESMTTVQNLQQVIHTHTATPHQSSYVAVGHQNDIFKKMQQSVTPWGRRCRASVFVVVIQQTSQ